ncbi:hypothetical protein MMC22_001162 [Lobaria immixta]|nr:hypothetical protein [Lobaria immixta]
MKKLCSQCNAVADELLAMLESFNIKGKRTKLQSLEKSLKSTWSKDKVIQLKKRLDEFRQELEVHVLFELNSQFNLFGEQAKTYFEALDESTKRGVDDILQKLHDQNDGVLASIQEQVQETRAFQGQAQKAVIQEIDALAKNLEKRSEETQSTADERQKSQAKLLDAIADAAIVNDNALTLGTENINHRGLQRRCGVTINATIKEETEDTRAHMTEIMHESQEVMKQQVHELQRGLQQLQSEIDRKLEDLKDLIVKINTTKEGPERQSMKMRGNAATIALFSLYELYRSINELLQPLLQQANMAVGTVTMATKSKALKLRSMFKIVASQRCNDSLSLPMYYVWYYEPMFFPSYPDDPIKRLFSKFVIEEKITSLMAKPDESTAGSELRAVYNLAREGNQTLWTLTAITAALNAYLNPTDATEVVQTVFSICKNPACLKFSKETYLDPRDFYDTMSVAVLRKPWYGAGTIKGQRLAEDIALWSRLAHVSGLQEEFSSGNCYLTKSNLAFILIALFEQPWPWVCTISHHMDGYRDLRVDPSAVSLVGFLYAIYAYSSHIRRE